MANENEILLELKEVSTTLANIGNKNVFHVPDGYFESLTGQIIQHITGEEEFQLPWMKSENKEPFKVPPAYFENLSGIILSKIKAAEANSHKEELELISPLLGKIEKAVPFDLPAGYFEEFPGDIMAGVNAVDYVIHELEMPSAVMHEIRGRNVYSVPDDYFNRLPAQLLSKVKDQNTGKLFQMRPFRMAARFAVAAVLAGAISVGAWMFFNQSTGTGASEITGIEKISDTEIEKYLETSSVSPTDNNLEDNSLASFELKDEDVKELLADVPDEELQQYLEEHAVSKDLKTN